MLVVQHANHYRPLDPDQSAIGHRRSGCDAQRLSCKAAFTEKVAGAENSDNGFFTLFGCNSEFDLAVPDVKDGIRGLALPENLALRTVLYRSVAAGDSRKNCFPIDRQDFLSFQRSLPMESSVACRAHSKLAAGIKAASRTLLLSWHFASKHEGLYVQLRTLHL